jgi:hypothetical protein
VATLVRYTGLSERTVRTCLDRLQADDIIAPCDPDIVAARIKRADRRPQGWDLNLSLVAMSSANPAKPSGRVSAHAARRSSPNGSDAFATISWTGCSNCTRPSVLWITVPG